MQTRRPLSCCLVSLLLSTGALAHAEDSPMTACFAPEQTEEIEPRFPLLSAYADELSQLAAEEKRVRGMAVYLLTRQLVLLERMQRRLQLHSDFCDSALDTLQRDFAILRRTNTAFTLGNTELDIAKLESEQAQALLAKIEAELAALAEPVAALRVTTSP